MSQTAIQVVFELSEVQAAALSEFLEYSTFSDFQRKAHHNIDQAHNMADAASRLRKTLASKIANNRHDIKPA